MVSLSSPTVFSLAYYYALLIIRTQNDKIHTWGAGDDRLIKITYGVHA